jgi:NADH-quinone oxidoreductase subunit I
MNVHDKYKPLTLWERTYLPRICDGLVVTMRHFFRNLWHFTLARFGVEREWKGAATYQYPEVRRPLYPRLRTLHRLTKREDGTPRCIACMMCETVCPAKCIYIVAASVRKKRLKNIRSNSISISASACTALLCRSVSGRRDSDGYRHSRILFIYAQRHDLTKEMLLSLSPTPSIIQNERVWN